MKNTKILSLLLFIQCSCGSGEDTQLILKKASQVHLEAVSIKKTVDSILVYEGGKRFDMVIADSINVVATEWEKGLIEVPGFKEAHGHHHHSHEHDVPKMTNKEMHEYQVLSRDAIKGILSDLEKIRR